MAGSYEIRAMGLRSWYDVFLKILELGIWFSYYVKSTRYENFKTQSENHFFAVFSEKGLFVLPKSIFIMP